LSALLELESVRVVARGRALLDGVSLRVEPGQFVALVGPNGAGKTSLLRAALGLMHPSSGSVRLGGANVTSLDPRARAAQVAWLPQHTKLEEPLTALETVAVARYRFREAHERSLTAARAALERAGASSFSDRRVTELSGGERQRVALAALLAQETPLLLVDEPANHLDPAQQIDAYELLGRCWRSGLGVLCVTHDVNLLAHVGESDRIRVVGLSLGRVSFALDYSAPELPAELGRLFGLALRAVALDDRRVILAEGGTRARTAERPR
jgi:iron complex transport system ATP-binding protein